MSGRRLLMAAMLVLAGAGSGRADGPPQVASQHRVGFDAGLASAVGSVGATYQYAPMAIARFEGGVGWGPSGAQLSVMPKVTTGSRACAFIAGFGASLALGGQLAAEGQGARNPSVIPWLNLESARDRGRSASGLSFQGTLGLTMPLVGFHYEVADTGSNVKAGAILPQGRVGIGWWF